ncbi:MAG: hypothetical protein RLZZ628_2879 [Bacteroidota bacterium]|jgi:hypothetical protein
MNQQTIKLVEIVENKVFPLRNFKFFTLKNVGTCDVCVNGVTLQPTQYEGFPQDLMGVRYNEDLEIVFKNKNGQKLLIIGRVFY